MQDKITPLGSLVMVRENERREEARGLLLPREVQPDIWEGQVEAYGPEVSVESMAEIDSCMDGVVYGAEDHEAKRYDIDGKKYLFIEESELMGAIFPGKGDRFPRVQASLGAWVLMVWEEAKDTLLGGLLVRPVQKAKAHFTGVAVSVGAKATEVETGKRYFFEQFSGFKSWVEGGKRYAFVPSNAIYCEIPERDADLCYAPSEIASPEFSEAIKI